MSNQKPALRVVAKDKPATVQELAQLEFRALKYFRGLSQKQRIEKTHRVVDAIRPMAVLASGIVAMEKSELIARVEAKHDRFGEMLPQLTQAKDDANAISEVIAAAETRLAVALADVERDADQQEEGLQQ